MDIKELENKLTSENLLQVYDKGSWKKYIGLKENRNFSYEQSYGIEKLEDGNYAVFIGGEQNERGSFVYYWDTYDSIEMACEKLYWKVNLLNEIYKEDQQTY